MGEFLETKEMDSAKPVKLVYSIDPKEIKYLPQKDFSIEDLKESIDGGNWDQGLERIENSEINRAVRDVFFCGKSWNETDYFSGRLDESRVIVPSTHKFYKARRCEYLNYLFRAMRAFGYVQDPFSDLVGICIGRNGEVILNNGRHRIAVAQALSIPSIPVTIDVRHSEWMRFCEEVHDYALHHYGLVYEPIDHVDLKHLPARQSRERLDKIIGVMSPKNESLVDLGANWGWMDKKLSEYVDYCVAVESDPVEFSFLRGFRRVYEGKYEIVQADAVDYIKKNKEWDCVLMLSLLHHIPIKQRDELFGAMRAREMFFQFPSKSELQVDVPQWINLILSSSCFNRVKQLTNTDRELFHFMR